MIRRLILFAAALLSGCGDDPEQKAPASPDSAGSRLESVAVERGVIPGPDKIALVGRFERRSDLGTDKFCAAEDGGDYAIGALAVFGPDSFCEARGTASRKGEVVRIRFKGKEDCAFDAHFDGVELSFPGALPDGCAHYCRDRASFSGVNFFLVEPGAREAMAARGREMERLCPG